MRYTAVSQLKAGMRVGQSILGADSLEKLSAGTVLSDADIELLKQKGIFAIYVMNDIPPEIISQGLMKKCIEALKNRDVDALIMLAEQIVLELTSKPISLDFKSVRSFDDYILHHSLCVSIYAVSIGIKMGMINTLLSSLALAGLLHDLGKTLLDSAIFEKKEQLTPSEYEYVKQHSTKSYEFIKDNPNISNMVKEAVLHHHENINGTGYPNRQSGTEVSMFSKILRVADVYDAIMSARTYKKGMSNAEAINYLMGGKTILFDERVVDEFVSIVTLYPTGTEIKLSNDEIGLVVGQTNDLARPLIYISSSSKLVNLATDIEYKDIAVIGDILYQEGEENARVQEVATVNTYQVPSKTKKKIMIVDDVAVSIAHTKIALGGNGGNYEIVSCLGGKIALTMIQSEMPDLILMDYEMPDMDGVATVNEIHKMGYTMPIIFLTGKSDKDTVCKCGACGAVDYILKPANPVYLKTRVEMALKRTNINSLLG